MDRECELKAAGEDGIEMMRSVRYSMLGIDSWETGLFDPADTEWRDWLNDVFRPLLMDVIRETHIATGETRLEEVFAADRRLGDAPSISEGVKVRSLELGRRLCESQPGAKSLRPLDRFREAVAAGTTPGHGPVAFALKCGLYHLPVLTTLLSYAFLEWKAAQTDRGTAASRVEDFFARPVNCQLLIDAQQYVFRSGMLPRLSPAQSSR
ncbi:MAG: hypothetical protein AAF514_15770 [Verrucomicrobiota bacterium]